MCWSSVIVFPLIHSSIHTGPDQKAGKPASRNATSCLFLKRDIQTTDIEQAIVGDLVTLCSSDLTQRECFREALDAAFSDLTAYSDRQGGQLKKRRSELQAKQERLLEAFLAGAIDEPVFSGSDCGSET